MTLELWNTLATVGTFIVIAVTAVAAMVQLRHLRAGNQINIIFSIDEKLQSPEFLDARALVRGRLASALEDPLFREYIAAESARRPAPDVPPEYGRIRNAARLVANRYESLGLLVKNGTIGASLFLDAFANIVNASWSDLERYVALTRDVSVFSLYENFEYVAVLSEDWLDAHPATYPKGVRRKQIRNRLPAPQSLQTH
jgi:hypothetical protein